MKRIVLGILAAVTAGTAALTIGAAPAHADEYYRGPEYGYSYGRQFREHQRLEQLRRERMRRLWLLRHGYLRDRW